MPIGLAQDPSVDLDRLDTGAAFLPVPQSARYAAEFGNFDFTRNALQFGRHLVADTLGLDPADPTNFDQDARLPAETANERYGVDGYLRFNEPITDDDAAWRAAGAHERRFRDIVLSRTRPTPLRDFGASLAGSLFDPTGLAVMLGTDGVASVALEGLNATRIAGETGAAVAKLGRVGNLAAETAGQLAKGAALNAPYVALDAGLSNWAGDDYTAGDALTDIAAGAILHTGLHLGGRALSALLPARGEPGLSPAAADLQPAAGAEAQRFGGTPPDAVTGLPPESRAGAFAKALDDLADDRPVDVGQYVAREVEGRGEPTGFTTADGSLYAIDEDGRVQRGEAGPDGLSPQPVAEATHYLAPDDAERLAQVHREGGVVDFTPDGYLGVRDAEGRFDGRILAQPAAEPAPGLVPVQLSDAGRELHAGHPIAEVRYGQPAAGVGPLDLARQDRAAGARSRKAGRRADAAARAEANSPATRRRLAAVEADPRTQRLRAAAEQLKAFAREKRVPNADALDRALSDETLRTGHPIEPDVEDFLRQFFHDDALARLKPRNDIRDVLRGHADFDLSRRVMSDLEDRFARNDPGKIDLREPGRAATPPPETKPLDLSEPAPAAAAPVAPASAAEPVARLTGDEIAPAGTPAKEFRAKAKAFFDAVLRPLKVKSEALGGREVGFNSTGRDKAVSFSGDPQKLQVFAALPQIIERGRLMRSEPPRDPAAERTVRAYHRIRGSVEIDGKPVEVEVVVRETENGDFHYDHWTKAEGPADPGTRSTPAHDAGGGTPGGEASTGNITPEGEKAKRQTGDQLIAADPELKALAEDTADLAARHGIEAPAVADNQNPNTLAEAIRAAAVCLIGEIE